MLARVLSWRCMLAATECLNQLLLPLAGATGSLPTCGRLAEKQSIPPTLPQRMYRMRAWRQSLTPEEHEQWVRIGAAGPALRSFKGCSPNFALEEHMVRIQPEGEAEAVGGAGVGCPCAAASTWLR